MPCWADPVWHRETVGGDPAVKGGYTAAQIGAPSEMARLEPHAQSFSPPGPFLEESPSPLRGDKAHGQDMPVCPLRRGDRLPAEMPRTT